MKYLLIITLFSFIYCPKLFSELDKNHYKNLSISELSERAKKDDILAQNWLARKSDSVETKIYWYEEAAKQGDIFSSSSLGHLYLNTNHKSLRKAFFWFLVTTKLQPKWDKKCEYKPCSNAAFEVKRLEKEMHSVAVKEVSLEVVSWMEKYRNQ